MWVGTSREKLEKLIDEQEESRVVLMMQQDTPERFLKIEDISQIQPSELDAFSMAAASDTIVQPIPIAVAATKEQEQQLFSLQL